MNSIAANTTQTTAMYFPTVALALTQKSRAPRNLPVTLADIEGFSVFPMLKKNPPNPVAVVVIPNAIPSILRALLPTEVNRPLVLVGSKGVDPLVDCILAGGGEI